MSEIKAITFDFWWTLFIDDTSTGVADNWRLDHVSAALSEAGYAVERERLSQAIARIRRHGLVVQEERGEEVTPEQQVESVLTELGLPATLHAAVLKPYISPYTELTLPLMPGALETLAALQQRYQLAVICNTGATPGSVLRDMLDRVGIGPYFTVQTYSNEEGLAKPRPEIFHRTLGRLGVEPVNAVHVGDNGRTDVAGAVAAGMQAIWFQSHPQASAPVAGQALSTITSFSNLLRLL